MINLLLSTHHREIIKCLRVTLSEVFDAFLNCLLAALKVHVYEAEAGVVDEEAKGDAAFVAGHS